MKPFIAAISILLSISFVLSGCSQGKKPLPAASEQAVSSSSSAPAEAESSAPSNAQVAGNAHPFPQYGVSISAPDGWIERSPQELEGLFGGEKLYAGFSHPELGIEIYVKQDSSPLSEDMETFLNAWAEAAKERFESIDPVSTVTLGGRDFQILNMDFGAKSTDGNPPDDDDFRYMKFVSCKGGENCLTFLIYHSERAKDRVIPELKKFVAPLEEELDGRNAGHWEGSAYLFESVGMKVVIPDKMRLATESELLRMGPTAPDYYCVAAMEDEENATPEELLRMRQIMVFALDDLGKSAEESLQEVLPFVARDNDAVGDIETMTISGFDFASVIAQKSYNGRLINKLYLLHAEDGKLINIIYTFNTLSEKEIMESLPALIVDAI